MNYKIYPPEEMIETSVNLPLSKSMSNRALIINALTPGAAPLTRVADCDDTAAVRRALDSGLTGEINVGAAGTAMRFLTALAACTPGHTVVIDGTDRMRQRPIAPLVDALRSLGADINYAGEEGYPPLRISGRELQGGQLAIPASVSSQYISALLMIAPAMSDGLSLTLEGTVTSRPYIDMTLGMMADAASRPRSTATPSPCPTAPTPRPICGRGRLERGIVLVRDRRHIVGLRQPPRAPAQKPAGRLAGGGAV